MKRSQDIVLYIGSIIIAILVLGLITKFLNNIETNRLVKAFSEEVQPQIQSCFDNKYDYLKYNGISVEKNNNSYAIIIDIETPKWLSYIFETDNTITEGLRLGVVWELESLASDIRSNIITSKPFTITIKMTRSGSPDLIVNEFGEVIYGLVDNQNMGTIDYIAGTDSTKPANDKPSLFKPE